MAENNIKAMLEFIIPRLVNLIMNECIYSEKEALIKLYESDFYRQLEKEETKLWHLSVPTLYELWKEENESGQIQYPEEA